MQLWKNRTSQTPFPDISTAEGFEQIYNLYSEKLLRIAYNQLKDKAEAENIVHDIFCSLWERRNELQIDRPLENYLIRAVIQASMAHKRKKYGRAQVDLSIHRNTPQHVNAVEETFQFNELMERTNSLVSQLPARCQEIYKLNSERALTKEEIASVLHLSPKTVEAHLTKAVKFLKGNLQVIRCLIITFFTTL